MTSVLALSQQPGVGGAERVAFECLRRADRLRIKVAAPPTQVEYARKLGLDAIDFDLPRLRTPLIGPMRLGVSALRLRRLTSKVDAQVLYANAIRAMGYALGCRLIGGPPVVAHDHHLLAEGDVTGIDGGLMDRRRFVSTLERMAAAIIVPSHAAARPFTTGRVYIVPNGIDLEHFRPPVDKGAARLEIGLDPDRPVVGLVTRADPDKGMSSFVEAALGLSRRHPDCTFLLAGGASFPHELDHYAQVQDRARLLGDRIVMTDRLYDPLPAFQAMDVMLHVGELPESFGLTVVEALACGVPVVGYRWGGVPEIVTDACGALVDPRDLEAAQDAVLSLLRDPQLMAQMGIAGRQRCIDSYDIKAMSERLQQIIEDAAR